MVSMSIIEQRFSAAALVLAEILFLALFLSAQEIEVKIEILPPDSVSVEGRFVGKDSGRSKLNWSFLNSIAGAENLAARISDFNLSGEAGRSVSFKKLADGEFLANEEATNFKYRLNIKSPPKAASMAHVSWLADEQGILMLGDLLPQFAANNQSISSRIKFELPAGWNIISGENKSGENVFLVKDVEKAVFAVGKNWREQEAGNLSLAIGGEWQFSDLEASKTVGEIYEEYRKLFGETVVNKAQIFLFRYPPKTEFGRWSAETRGANLMIASSDMPFKSQSVQRLHEQLRHELFHLWLPNQLALTGNYDWFYEGFTVYQALRTGVRMNRIRFEDYLDTLAQAYNFDNLQSGKFSLIELSKSRRSGENNRVYARGMLAAFLTDLAILRSSRGKRSIEKIFRDVYQKHRLPNQSANGSEAIVRILRSYPELGSIIEKYIAGTDRIDWKNDLNEIGIEAVATPTARLVVKPKLNGQQKDLLNELGYNNWRKQSEKRK